MVPTARGCAVLPSLRAISWSAVMSGFAVLARCPWMVRGPRPAFSTAERKPIPQRPGSGCATWISLGGDCAGSGSSATGRRAAWPDPATNGIATTVAASAAATRSLFTRRLLEDQERDPGVLARARVAVEHAVVDPVDAASEPLLRVLRQHEVERHQRDREELALVVLEVREDPAAQLPVLHRQRVLVRRARRRGERPAEPQDRAVPERLHEHGAPAGPQHAPQLLQRHLEVEVVQDAVADDQ